MNNLVLKLFGLCYDSGIASLSPHLSLCMGIFGLVLVMSFHNQDLLSDAKFLVSDLFLEDGYSIPRSLSNNHLV